MVGQNIFNAEFNQAPSEILVNGNKIDKIDYYIPSGYRFLSAGKTILCIIIGQNLIAKLQKSRAKC